MKRAVDPEPDPGAVLHRFEVHIAGPVGCRPGDHAVDERGRRSLGHLVVQVELGPRNIDDYGPGVVGLGAREPIAVVLVEPSLDLGLQRDHRLHAAARGEPEIVERIQVFLAGDRDDQRGADLEQRKGHVLARHLLGQAPHRLRIHGVGVDTRRAHAELRTQRIEHTFGGGETHLDQHPAQAPPGALLPVHRLRQLLFGDQRPFEENLAEGPCGGEASRTSRRCGRRLGRFGTGVSVRWLRVGGGRGR